MAQLPPGGTDFTDPDVVLWAKLKPGGQDHTDDHNRGIHTYREVWIVRLNVANASPAQVRASTRIPAEGFPLYQHVPADDALLLGTYVRTDPLVTRDTDAVAVVREVRMDADPYYAEVTVSYEGVDDPTAEPPEFAVSEVPYQEHVAYDVNGKPIMNSAFDGFEGGMPTEGFYKRLTITRNLPYDSWYSKKADPYRKTLNRQDFTYSGQVDELAAAVKELFGTCLLDSVSEVRVTRKRGVGTANSFYWRVTAEILVDQLSIRLPDGTSVLRAHRWVVADAGYSAFSKVLTGPPLKYGKQVILNRGQPVSQPQLLNGMGELLVPTQVNPISFNPHLRTSALGGLCPDFYATAMSTAITVSDALGVLANDRDPLVTSVTQVGTGSAEGGTVSLSPGGGFTYTPAAGFVGWDRFYYKASGDLDANKQVVQILVGAVPVLLFFDRYKFGDWAQLSVLLEGW